MALDIVIVRLLNGEELIAEVLSEEDSVIEIQNPVRIVMMPNKVDPTNPSIGLAPWAEFSTDKKFIINKNAIITVMEPITEFKNEYNRIHSGIVTPTSKLILPS